MIFQQDPFIKVFSIVIFVFVVRILTFSCFLMRDKFSRHQMIKRQHQRVLQRSYRHLNKRLG